MTDILIPTLTGKAYPSWAVQAVDALLTKLRTRPMWEGIEFLVSVYFKRFPEVATELKKQKQTRTLKNKHASNKARDLRHTAEIPEALMDLLDYFYHDEIEQDRKKFYREFAKRYPIFRTPDVL